MTQKEQVLAYLRQGYSLTPLEALEKFGSFRLGAIIFDLKQEGYEIENVGESKHGKHYGKYILKTKEDIFLGSVK